MLNCVPLLTYNLPKNMKDSFVHRMTVLFVECCFMSSIVLKTKLLQQTDMLKKEEYSDKMIAHITNKLKIQF